MADNGPAGWSATQGFPVPVNSLTQPSTSSFPLNNGLFGFPIGAREGWSDYDLQESSNPVDWSAIFISNLPAMPFSSENTSPGTLPMQFYRNPAGPPLP